jgi:hypothetical protein
MGIFDGIVAEDNTSLDISTVNYDLEKAQNAESALEELQTERFYNTLRSYYTHREGDNKFHYMNHADLLEYFYNDRSWRNHNTISMGMDMSNAMSDSPDRLKEFAYIQQTYEALPSFWDDPNRNFGSWLWDNGGAMVLDPVNLIGFGIGGQAGKQAYKVALKEALKGKMAKEINKRALLEVQKQASKQSLWGAVKKGALYEGYIGGAIATSQDAILQNTAIKTGIQKEYDLMQTGWSSLAGFGFGTVFGATFTGAGFKLATRKMRSTAVKQLNDLHEYGRSEITGQRLFKDLGTVKEKKSYYKNLSKEEINQIEYKSRLHGKGIKDQVDNLDNIDIDGTSKPPKELLNWTKYSPKRNAILLKYLADKAFEEGRIDTKTITNDEIVKISKVLGEDPDVLRKAMKSTAKKEKYLAAQMVAHGDMILKHSDDMIKLANKRQRLDLTTDEKAYIDNRLALKRKIVSDTLVTHKEVTQLVARAQQAGKIHKDSLRASELIINPENPKIKELLETNPDKFWEAVAKLDTDEQVIVALQNAHKVGKWDLATEFVNNNLLSSPDTHILNIISSLMQTQYKPVVMLIRAAMLNPIRNKRARQLAIEAMDTYIHQYVYVAHALRSASKSFVAGRGLLDSKQMKYDNAMRQGQLQHWIEATGELITSPFGVAGEVVQKGLVKPLGLATTLPLRFLSSGDEFLKTMMFKARRTSQIHSRIRSENDSKIFSSYFKDADAKAAYKKRFKEIEGFYQTEAGEAIPTIAMSNKAPIDDINRLQVNDPLQYAREGTYTQSAYSTNPITGKDEGGFTGWILEQTSKGNRKAWRALGLHFVNTPANLIKWNFEQIPVLRKALVHTRHALAEGADGKYLNPEAAAEANARMAAGFALWTGAFFAWKSGKITGGGSRDWKENKAREEATGWQKYSYKRADGTYVSLHRLDPVMFPFFMMADIMDTVTDFLRTNEDLPYQAQNTLLELSMGMIATITRNLASKFYATNIIETMNFALSDDMMKSRAPDRVGTSMFARAIYKFFPLSGGLRYWTRVDEDYQKELFTLSDRLKQLIPLTGKDSIMPRRNIFGEKIDRKNGWLFGLGGEVGLWSTPFAMTKFKNQAVAKFFENREFNYRAPNPVDVKSKLDLRTIRNETTGQTAYDRLRELVGTVDLQYKGEKYKLKELMEVLILDKNSPIYDVPDGMVDGKDWRQSVLLKYVHQAEKLAYEQMIKEYAIILRRIEKREQFNIFKFKQNKGTKKKEKSIFE